MPTLARAGRSLRRWQTFASAVSTSLLGALAFNGKNWFTVRRGVLPSHAKREIGHEIGAAGFLGATS